MGVDNEAGLWSLNNWNGNKAVKQSDELNCREWDLNPQGINHTPLKRARMPIPPSRRISALKKNALSAGIQKLSLQKYYCADGPGACAGEAGSEGGAVCTLDITELSLL
jgi:hypothetical protein